MKALFLAATLVFLLSFTIDAQAQRSYSPKFRGSLYNSFRRADKWTFIAGTGISVMNSDNTTRNYSSSIGLMKGNGYGVNANAGVMYQFTPQVALLGNLEYARFNGAQDMAGYKLKNSFSFSSEAVSFSGSAVFNIANNYTLAGLYRRSIRNRMIMVPYAKVGLGVMRYNAVSFGEATDEPDSEFKPTYPAIAAVIPVSAGLRFRCSNEFSFAPELTLNLTTTDYLDNTKRKGGYTGSTDQFVTASIKVFYTPHL
ncbi:hypothetical protein [Pontibacter harenae]|uniref:hypothetical protein n=1 Tax=Pontibacter harenae TaxID=2894083 RepID=UPI001E3172A7|nr:hypothetical protein [Pontibacter harenae]MCC9166164.1 hypothetical protein [Pontibacter harenae]